MKIDLSRYKKNVRLHSKEHLLADDLSRAMREQKRFPAYLGIAKRYSESDLRALARYIVEKEDLPTDARGKYFFAAVRGLKKKSAAAKAPAGAPMKQKRKKKKPKKKKRTGTT